MEVILKQDVDRIGKSGSIVKVKDGFARNFLFPNKLAIPVTTQNLKVVENDKQRKLLASEKSKKEAEDLKVKLSSLSITMPVLTQEDEKLYGSIAAHDIAASLKEEGFSIDKSCVLMEEPIKALGIYEITVKLHPEVSTKVKIWVVKK